MCESIEVCEPSPLNCSPKSTLFSPCVASSYRTSSAAFRSRLLPNVQDKINMNKISGKTSETRNALAPPESPHSSLSNQISEGSAQKMEPSELGFKGGISVTAGSGIAEEEISTLEERDSPVVCAIGKFPPESSQVSQLRDSSCSEPSTELREAEDSEAGPSEQQSRSCGDEDEKCDSDDALVFPQRILGLPPVAAAVGAYARVKSASPLAGRVLSAAEVAALVATAPARVASRSLRGVFNTPLFVADLLLCKGLDMAQRVAPCLQWTPAQNLRNVGFCACVAPAGACYLCTSTSCRALRMCACDAPVTSGGGAALVCLSAADTCLCGPATLCAGPTRIALHAMRSAVKDVEEIVADVKYGVRAMCK